MTYLSMAIYKLFTNYPTFSFDYEKLLVNFIEFVYQSIAKLTFPALKLALVSKINFPLKSTAVKPQIDNDHTYHEALHNFYQVWQTFYRIKELMTNPWYPDAENSELGVILSEKLNNTLPKVLETFIKG